MVTTSTTRYLVTIGLGVSVAVETTALIGVLFKRSAFTLVSVREAASRPKPMGPGPTLATRFATRLHDRPVLTPR